MTRGNQREKAREKNLKKKSQSNKKSGADEKGGNKGKSLDDRRQRDADAMRLKQQKAAEKQNEPEGASGGTSK